MKEIIEEAKTPQQLIHSLSLLEVCQEAHDFFWKKAEEEKQEKIRQEYQKLFH